MHPLLLEDILNTTDRPKIEEYDNCLFIILKMMYFEENSSKLIIEHVSIVIGEDYIISFQEQPGDVFDGIRKRMRVSRGAIRKKGPDYLAYAMIDAIVDNYFIVLENIEDSIENIEEDFYIIKSETEIYIKDIYDHIIEVNDSIQLFMDAISNMLDIYLSSVSNKLNQIMKVLTILSTIFIPLSFIAGVYGMNFENMPELKSPYGYPIIWVVMISLAVVMLISFKRKKWF